jgi:ABC-type glycerol-3-phosphate transport system substrate-binding protein
MSRWRDTAVTETANITGTLVEESMTKFRFIAPFAVAMLVLAGCPAGTTPSPGGGGGTDGGAGGSTIEVTSLWGGAEGEAFGALLEAFTEASGVEVEYTTVRQDYSTVLNNRLAQGDPPDVAIIPGVGFLRSFAADDLLIPLADLGIDDSFIDTAYAGRQAQLEEHRLVSTRPVRGRRL